MTAYISRPNVVSFAIAFLNFATLVELAGTPVVGLWTGIMYVWCLSYFVTGRGETVECAVCNDIPISL